MRFDFIILKNGGNMLDKNILEKYAELIFKVGVNLQNGQGVEIACPVEKSFVAETFTEVAYSLGASMVNVRWNNQKIDRLTYINADDKSLVEVPKWFVASKQYLVEKNFCYVAISAEDPMAFYGVDENRLIAVSKAKSIALKKFSETVMKNGIRWCVVSVPTKAWAKSVFPNSAEPELELEKAIINAMRLNCSSPLSAWQEHIKTLDKHARFLNDCNFDYLHFTSKNGTDLKVGLAKNHKWLSAKEKALDGIEFVANMPTEEIFTAPNYKMTEGIVKSTKPLAFNGNLIEDFSITFKKGKIVDFSAKKGYLTLKGIIETDNGTKSIGEVALIGKSSPIAKSKILFLNTLFDENASCHLALGKGYPTTVENGENLSVKELKDLGVNDSVEHVDFMIGDEDTNIYGVKKDGTKIQIFIDGDWAI